MPLIIFTGFPASGKSTRAQQLRDYFSTTKKVTILSENDIAKKKNDIHAGTVYAAILHSLLAVYSVYAICYILSVISCY